MDHLTGAGAGGGWMIDRVVGRGSLEHGGENGGFGYVHFASGFAKVFLCRLFDAGGAGTIINAIEIKLEDIVLGIFGFKPNGEDEFLQFTLHGSLRFEKKIFCKLLGDGGAALDNVAGAKIAESGAAEADRIYAEMRIEAPILNRDHRLGNIGGQLVEPDLVAEERAALGDHLAISSQKNHSRLALGDFKKTLLIE